ncbi:MAG: HNH endonuclease [Actinomycetes bacterium]
MAWLRTDDQAPDHPKILKAASSPRPTDLVLGPEAFAATVFGVVSLCAAWSAGKLQDGWVPEALMRRIAGRDSDLIAKSAVRADLLSKRQRGPLNEWGWYVVQTDELLHMRSKEEVHADREKSRVTRQTGATREVRLRDGDQCRYCGKSVSWVDRVSARGGSYDHPDPSNRDVFVVACLGCNRHFTSHPEEQRPPLLPIPDVPLIGPDTAQQFSVPQSAPARAHGAVATCSAGTPAVPAAAPARTTSADAPADDRSVTARPEGSGSGPICDLPSEVVQGYPRRDGTGRDGSGVQPIRAGPRSRPRGSRGRGQRKQPPAQQHPKD